MPKINITVKLLFVIIMTFLFGNYLPTKIASGFLACSHTLKEIIVFLLPIIIFSSILSCMLSLKSRALSFLATVFLLVSFSNFSFTIISYYITTFSFETFQLKLSSASCGQSGLMPLWNFVLFKWIPNDYALFSGLAVGTLFTFYPNSTVDKLTSKLKLMVDVFLQKMFLPILPLFIFGFLLKLKIDGTLNTIVSSYLPILCLIATTYVIGLTLIYLTLAGFNFKKFIKYLRNAFPAGLVGFSTMSSIAAMPVNLISAAKNTNDSPVAEATIPAAVNIHLIGDSLGIPILALAVIMTFGLPIPDMSIYIYFSIYFMLTKFATAAVPCGTIMIMIPVLEKYLGFNSEMSGLIMAIYMLIDPMITATSVLGNSAFAIMMHKMFDKKLGNS